MKEHEPPAPWRIRRCDDGTGAASEPCPAAQGETPHYWLLSPKQYRELTTEPPAPCPARRQGGIAPQLLDVTGLGLGGRPSFVRVPNKALVLYRNKKLITAPQYGAGFRLWLDFEEASIQPAFVPELGRIIVDGGRLPDWPLTNIDATRRLSAAVAAVEGATGRAMVVRVCLHGDTRAEGVFAHYTDTKRKMARFREALDDLCRHYGRRGTVEE